MLVHTRRCCCCQQLCFKATQVIDEALGTLQRQLRATASTIASIHQKVHKLQVAFNPAETAVNSKTAASSSCMHMIPSRG